MDEESFAWLSDWKTAPIKTVAGQQDLPISATPAN